MPSTPRGQSQEGDSPTSGRLPANFSLGTPSRLPPPPAPAQGRALPPPMKGFGRTLVRGRVAHIAEYLEAKLMLPPGTKVDSLLGAYKVGQAQRCCTSALCTRYCCRRHWCSLLLTAARVATSCVLRPATRAAIYMLLATCCLPRAACRVLLLTRRSSPFLTAPCSLLRTIVGRTYRTAQIWSSRRPWRRMWRCARRTRPRPHRGAPIRTHTHRRTLAPTKPSVTHELTSSCSRGIKLSLSSHSSH